MKKMIRLKTWNDLALAIQNVRIEHGRHPEIVVIGSETWGQFNDVKGRSEFMGCILLFVPGSGVMFI